MKVDYELGKIWFIKLKIISSTIELWSYPITIAIIEIVSCTSVRKIELDIGS